MIFYVDNIYEFDRAQHNCMLGEVLGCARVFVDINGKRKYKDLYACFLKTCNKIFVYPSMNKLDTGDLVKLKNGDIFFGDGLKTVDPVNNHEIDLGMCCNWDVGVYWLDFKPT